MSATINAANFLMLSVFGIAAVGYLLGRITIKGISLGTAGVFVIALIYGAFSGTHFNSKFVIEEINYASQALKIIENLGLVFFVTSVGFIAGPNFFKNMKHNFKSYVLLGVVIILSGGLTAILCLLVGRAIEAGQPGYDPNQLTAMISGLLAGSLTSTPAFSATKEAVAAQYQDAVTVGYGIAYLFGVIGVVLFVQLMPRVVHADLDEERKKITHVETGDVAKFKGKLLEFKITGEVDPGTNLTLSIGQKSQSYDALVPRSAVRSDSNGDFVLVITAKSTPLGNRYMATRVDVKTLATDDTMAAVSGLSNNDFVITNSSKPIETGMQVRIADN